MRPQDLCWGFARNIRFSFITAACMFLGWFFFDHRRFTRFVGPIKWMTLFGVLTTISLFTSDLTRDDKQIAKWIDLLKVFLVAMFTVGLVDDRQRLTQLMWVITLSLGFYGVKCGLFTVLKGGRILQGPGGMMLDNNDLCLAMAMNIPFLLYMGRTSERPWVRRFLYVAVFLTCMTVIA